MSNLAEIEFFHLGRNQNPQFEDVLKVIRETVDDVMASVETGADIKLSSRTKTIVRFYDTDGVLTQLALEVKRVESAKAESMRAFMYVGWLQRKWLGVKVRLLAKRVLSLHKVCKRQAVEQLHKAILANRVLALEVSDVQFRLVRRDEFAELLETAKGSYSVWLSVFEPNDLFSLNNKHVATTI